MNNPNDDVEQYNNRYPNMNLENDDHININKGAISSIEST